MTPDPRDEQTSFDDLAEREQRGEFDAEIYGIDQVELEALERGGILLDEEGRVIQGNHRIVALQQMRGH